MTVQEMIDELNKVSDKSIRFVVIVNDDEEFELDFIQETDWELGSTNHTFEVGITVDREDQPNN